MAVNGSLSADGVDGKEDPAEDDVDDVDRRSPKRGQFNPKRRRRLPFLIVFVVVVAGVAVTAIWLGSSKPGFYTFQDRRAGFKLSYPSSWIVSHPGDPNVPAVMSFGADGLDILQIRVDPVQASVNTTNVADIKSVTDAIISGIKVNVLTHKAITMSSLPGYYYFYTLPAYQGVTLVHSRFFLFPPHEMVTLLFQTVDHDFSSNAAAFDHVVRSFRSTS